MRKILTIVVICIGLAAPQAGHADCLACWNLRGVVVELSGGEVIEGYMLWNDAWYDSYNEIFPESLLSRRDKIEKVRLYRHEALRMIRYPNRGLVSINEGETIMAASIKGILLKAGEHDGYEGAGSLPVMSEKDAAMLAKPPIARCSVEGDVSVEYWLSYNKSVGKKGIRCLCFPKECDRSRVESLRKKSGLIHIRSAFD